MEPVAHASSRRRRRSSSTPYPPNRSDPVITTALPNTTSNMSSGNFDPRRSTGSLMNPARRDSREPPSLPPLRFSGSESRRSLGMADRQDDPTYRRRSAASFLTSYQRDDLDQSLGQERDRNQHRTDPAEADTLGPSANMPQGISEHVGNHSVYNSRHQDTSSSALISPPIPEDYQTDSRRIKRRKLDSDFLSRNHGFRYGYYGQVEPGTLKMELVSCDGGMYEGEPQYAAENMLKDDNSVYCTKGTRCNILLRHQGTTVFTLKELIIKAPGTDFDAPVRNGFVFVSMAEDDMLNRTAKYQIQYLKPFAQDNEPQERSPAHAERGRGTPGNYPPTNESTFESFILGADGDTRPYYYYRPRRMYTLSEGLGLDDEDNDAENENNPYDDDGEAQMPQEFNTEAPAFNVTTECSDDESSSGRPRYRRAPNRIGSLPFESDSDDGRIPLPTGYGSFEEIARWRRRERRRRLDAGESGFDEAAEEHQIAMQEAVRAVGGTLLQPLAKFSIDKDKNKCTIKFDPPASARFLLLKIWNPTRDPMANIDIKAIVVKGYAGPRYFPSVEHR